MHLRLGVRKFVRAGTAVRRLFLAAIVAPALSSNCMGQYTSGGANVEAYQSHIDTAAMSDAAEQASMVNVGSIPTGFQPWWNQSITSTLQPEATSKPVDIESLLIRTLEHSAQVKVFSDLPLIRQTAITEACASFDWSAFMNTRWDDTSDPVGNTLTTGGASRYNNNQWTATGGVARRNTYGGRFEAAQDLGFQNTNSTFFQPNDQGTSRIRLSYVQPLMRGRGQVYNNSLVVLAKIDTSVANDEFSRQLQSHLLEVTRAYWALYLERVSLIQKRRLLEMGVEIAANLEARSSVDVVGSQLVRVNAAVANRRAELVRAEMAVRNSQDRIQALVNDPEFALALNLEMIPTHMPIQDVESLEIGDVLTTALQMRPEVNQAIKQVKAACIRLGMSRNELMPQFDFIAETYVAGLRGRSDLGGAWADQFSEGTPSYALGLAYEMPIGNRAARARLTRRTLEVRQLQNQFRATVETLLMETKVAAREVRTSERDSVAKYVSMMAAANRLDNVVERWAHLPGVDQSVGLYLEDVLDAQSQLTVAEFEFAKAQTTYNLSLMNLKRATGTLLQHENITSGVGYSCGLPMTMLDKDGIASTSMAPSLPYVASSESMAVPDSDYLNDQTEVGLIDAGLIE
ncbi:Outer membrane efflux protein [Rubripirellula tenax]|uniref:Outer membrane efflux protein n=1 Tax=Rubripirellula tenax TaxID=2528015 RepID=A0A5C6FIS6_9BACT|nr:TolC family protein [Rubripirellula tenax]TWU59987.1 Outer membrane efflux protein [Rubripirellula tenax]